jgi:DNA-binding CsgD family transcriptional regulator
MSDKLAEYKKQQELTAKLLQGAKDEIVLKLSDAFQAANNAIAELKQLAPEYKVTELSDWKELAAKVGITPKAAKSTGRGKAAKASGELTPKEKEILAYLGKDGKKNAEINKHFKMKNSSVNTSKMKAKGVIVKKAGKWFAK